MVVGERDRRVHLVRPDVEDDVDAQLAECLHGLGVELGDRPRRQPDEPLLACAAAQPQVVGDEVELEVEGPAAVGDRPGGETTGADVQGHLPPVVEERALREPDLPHDLGPHVQGVAGLGPVLDPQSWPHAR